MSRIRSIAVWFKSICASLAAAACIGPGAASPAGARQDDFVSRAVFVDGALWLLSDDGNFSSLAPAAKGRLGSGLAGPVLDVCVREGQLRALACDDQQQPCAHWRLVARIDGDWHWRAVLPALDERVLALSCGESETTIVTSGHAIRIERSKITSIQFSQPLPDGVASVHVAAPMVFVGINAGEWGGGLLRIDATGTVNTVEKNASGELCGGPLNARCDPVNAIIDDPWQPGCVVAAIGLMHFAPHGRIVRVCGSEVSRVFFKPYGQQKKRSANDDEPFDSVAFYGLARVGTQVLAIGLDGLYRFDDWTHVSQAPLPALESIDGIAVSFELPDAALVLTSINQRRSISGKIPLLVPR